MQSFMSWASPHSPHSHKRRTGGRDLGHGAAAGQTARAHIWHVPVHSARLGHSGAALHCPEASESLSPQPAVFFVACGIVSHDPLTSDPTGPQRSLTGT